jgi:hypothetical protein
LLSCVCVLSPSAHCVLALCRPVASPSPRLFLASCLCVRCKWVTVPPCCSPAARQRLQPIALLARRAREPTPLLRALLAAPIPAVEALPPAPAPSEASRCVVLLQCLEGCFRKVSRRAAVLFVASFPVLSLSPPPPTPHLSSLRPNRSFFLCCRPSFPRPLGPFECLGMPAPGRNVMYAHVADLPTMSHSVSTSHSWDVGRSAPHSPGAYTATSSTIVVPLSSRARLALCTQLCCGACCGLKASLGPLRVVCVVGRHGRWAGAWWWRWRPRQWPATATAATCSLPSLCRPRACPRPWVTFSTGLLP